MIEKIKKFVPILVAVVVVLGSFKLILMPTWEKAKQIPGEVKAAEEKLTRIEEKITFLAGIDERDIVSKLEALERALPGEKDPIAPILAIRSGTGRAGALLLALDTAPGEVGGAGAAQSLLYSAKIAGTKEQIKGFLEELKTTTPLLWVGGLTFAEEGVGAGVGSGEFAVQSFYIPGTIDLGETDSPLIPLDSKEEEILSMVANLREPIVIPVSGEGGTFTGEVGKTNPFR